MKIKNWKKTLKILSDKTTLKAEKSSGLQTKCLQFLRMLKTKINIYTAQRLQWNT